MHRNINLIAAIQKSDRGIGNGPDLLYRIKDDMRYFVEKTTGGTVIMGRVTWDTIPPEYRPLEDRVNIVVTRNPAFVAEDAVVANSIEQALELAKEIGRPIFGIGGGEIYAGMMEKAERLYLTVIDGNKPANVFFPEYENVFKNVVSNEERVTKNDLRYAFIVLEK